MERIQSHLKELRRSFRLPFEDGYFVLAYVNTQLGQWGRVGQIRSSQNFVNLKQHIDCLLPAFNSFRKNYVNINCVPLEPEGVLMVHLDRLYNVKELIEGVVERIDSCLTMKKETEKLLRVLVAGLPILDPESQQEFTNWEADSLAIDDDFMRIIQQLENAIESADLLLFGGGAGNHIEYIKEE